ncbi:MAG: fumarylacetoacetate hydrolase family protein [Bacteriovoracaceae bacterium]|nr:fumarylacetoacetate hydrolase family protein [Bacteriovoracaceae bacterium]
MDQLKINEMAETLHNARLEAKAIGQFSANIEDFPRESAYSIQEEGIRMREKAGESVIGLKMGLTSEAKRRQMNLDAPLYGVLTDKMQVPNEGTYQMKGSIHPKIEPEIAFLIKKDLKGKVSREEVLDSTEAICPALEILDSRYEGFKYFSMEDVISDNSSSSHFILGKWEKDFKALDLKNLNMLMKVNDQIVQEGSSSAISGDPVVSIMQQCELLAKRDQYIKAGTFVLAGAATPAVALEPEMEVSLSVEGLSKMSVQIKE